MDCGRIDLIGYHLGAMDAGRELVERHLLDCTACLEAYLALKREADHGSGLRPSGETRARLRRDVQAAFSPRPAARLVRWLERPVPLYKSVVALAAVAAMALLATTAFRAPTAGARGESERIDTSRPVAESFSIY
jgi:hypothetical protein